MSEQTLTVKEAIEQGYTMALSEDGDYGIRLSDLAEDEQGLDNIDLYVASKETFNFSISAGAIQDLLEQHITDQDEVNDENDILYDQLAKVDFEAIAEIVNKVFTTKYHSVTDIKLVS